MNLPRTGLVLLTAGGTGGHVFPAEALADALVARGRKVAFVTDGRGGNFGGTLGSLDTYLIRAGGLAGRGVTAAIKGAGELVFGFLQARRLLKRLAPSAVIGFGGYASVPTMLAATMAGVPTALHEQNAVLGRANRLLASRVTRIATSFRDMGHFSEAWRGKVVCTGMPVRSAIVAFRAAPYPALDEGSPFRIMIMGGSQGARILSQVVPAALTSLPLELRNRLSISQQCRSEDLEVVRGIYNDAGIHVTLASFFQDVPTRLADAHLVITRSGASTMSELTTIGRPAILVPFPHAIDDHQTANARALDEAGGGWLIPQSNFTPDFLAGRIRALLSLPDSLARAAACARSAGTPDAAAKLADLVDGLLTVESVR